MMLRLRKRWLKIRKWYLGDFKSRIALKFIVASIVLIFLKKYTCIKVSIRIHLLHEYF